MSEDLNKSDLKTVMASARELGTTKEGREALLRAVASAVASPRAEEIDEQADEAFDSAEVRRAVMERAMEACAQAAKSHNAEELQKSFSAMAVLAGAKKFGLTSLKRAEVRATVGRNAGRVVGAAIEGGKKAFQAGQRAAGNAGAAIGERSFRANRAKVRAAIKSGRNQGQHRGYDALHSMKERVETRGGQVYRDLKARGMNSAAERASVGAEKAGARDLAHMANSRIKGGAESVRVGAGRAAMAGRAAGKKAFRVGAGVAAAGAAGAAGYGASRGPRDGDGDGILNEGRKKGAYKADGAQDLAKSQTATKQKDDRDALARVGSMGNIYGAMDGMVLGGVAGAVGGGIAGLKAASKLTSKVLSTDKAKRILSIIRRMPPGKAAVAQGIIGTAVLGGTGAGALYGLDIGSNVGSRVGAAIGQANADRKLGAKARSEWDHRKALSGDFGPAAKERAKTVERDRRKGRDGDGDGVLNEGKARKADLVSDLQKRAPDNPFIEAAAAIAELPPEAREAAVSELAVGLSAFMNSPRTLVALSN